jgi:1,4-alpha-glucan branching enzyme
LPVASRCRQSAGTWLEVFNSDAPEFGGWDVRNPGAIASSAGVVTVNIPANGIVVLQRQ